MLKDASAQAIADAKAMLKAGKVSVMLQQPCDDILFSRAKVYSHDGWACVTIVGGHTHIVRIETHNGVKFSQQASASGETQESPLAVLSETSLEEILAFVNTVPFNAIRFILDAARLNGALSQEGLRETGGCTSARRWKSSVLAVCWRTISRRRSSSGPARRRMRAWAARRCLP